MHPYLHPFKKEAFPAGFLSKYRLFYVKIEKQECKTRFENCKCAIIQITVPFLRDLISAKAIHFLFHVFLRQ